MTCPLGILIFMTVEILMDTLLQAFVYRVTAASLDRLSGTSHFCWNLQLEDISI